MLNYKYKNKNGIDVFYFYCGESSNFIMVDRAILETDGDSFIFVGYTNRYINNKVFGIGLRKKDTGLFRKYIIKINKLLNRIL